MGFNSKSEFALSCLRHQLDTGGLRLVHTGCGAPGKRHRAHNQWNLWQLECSHSKQTRSRSKHFQEILRQICFRILCEQDLLLYLQKWCREDPGAGNGGSGSADRAGGAEHSAPGRQRRRLQSRQDGHGARPQDRTPQAGGNATQFA